MTSEEMLARLVAFPTVTGQPNRAMTDFIADWLAGHGVEATYLPDPEIEGLGSLYAQIGPAVPGGAILSGHMDVVPVEGQDWSADPFTLTRRGDRLHGRGACDMKGFLAVALALVPEIQAAGLKRPVQLVFSHDEEVGCISARDMIAAMRGAVPPAAMAFVGEPTLLKVVTGHKGIMQLQTTVTGHEVHSSILHRGVPAVMVAARLIGWLEAQNAANRAAAEGRPDSGFDPPWTTLHAGIIAGGTAINITAKHCAFSTDIRTMPDESLAEWEARYRGHCAEVEAEIRQVHPGAGIAVERVAMVEGCRPEPGGAAEAEARAITGDNASHMVAYGTEAGYFQEGGYSTVVCGPGSIAQAHQPDEWIDIAQLRAGERFIRRLIARLAA